LASASGFFLRRNLNSLEPKSFDIKEIGAAIIVPLFQKKSFSGQSSIYIIFFQAGFDKGNFVKLARNFRQRGELFVKPPIVL
jgi:hypothetical protein